jgi:hypothetical protein
MIFSRIEASFDKFAPVFLMALGLFAGFATAGLGA